MRRLLIAIAGLIGLSAFAQDFSFDRSAFETLQLRSHTCTGFFDTASWKCEAITVPVYLRRASDRTALVLISHGSRGLDKRHADYAKQLTDNGINAALIGHWEARSLASINQDFDGSRRKGGDSPNMVLDVLAIASQLQSMPEWASTKFGHMGESMGGTTAMNLTRPYLRRTHAELFGAQPPPWSALVSLYAGCTERNTAERFLPYPLLFMIGSDDDFTLASDCEKQVPWMNARGGRAEILVLKGQVHSFDGLVRWRRVPSENTSKCASLRDGDTFTLEATGKEYPGTTEGYAQLRRDCIKLSPPSVFSGNKGDPRTGYAEWTAFLKTKLLH